VIHSDEGRDFENKKRMFVGVGVRGKTYKKLGKVILRRSWTKYLLNCS
jgi:hypothetical protein